MPTGRSLPAISTCIWARPHRAHSSTLPTMCATRSCIWYIAVRSTPRVPAGYLSISTVPSITLAWATLWWAFTTTPVPPARVRHSAPTAAEDSQCTSTTALPSTLQILLVLPPITARCRTMSNSSRHVTPLPPAWPRMSSSPASVPTRQPSTGLQVWTKPHGIWPTVPQATPTGR